MDYDAVLVQVLDLLQREHRLSYRILKRRFALDDNDLEDLKEDLIYAKKLAVDEDNRVLVWAGEPTSASAPPSAPGTPQRAAPSTEPERALLSYTPSHLAEKILTSRSALEGERKQVTVLFADVAGFTTLAEQLDPEVVHDIINRCFEGITVEVHHFEGTINQYTGDGVMALFGAPLAHEDSPRRAVHAALGIQRAIRAVAQTLQTERGLRLEMRIGINTGLVVVGKIGDDLRMDYTAVGDTTNLAARLQQIAQPGSVVISAATQQHVAGFFDIRDLGETPVKGRAPVHAFEVLRPHGRRTRFDVAVERGLTPLVGRERELATLCERFREVTAGRGQVVGIAGEAGIGKSRLVLEFRRALAQAGDAVTWLEGHCISFGQASPFLPLIEQLRENFQLDEVDGEPEIIAKVEQGMRRMGDLEVHIPAMRYLLSVDPGDPALAAMEGAARRRHLFAALRALALRGARLRPLVLVVEDLHWIDTSSEEFLTFLLDAVVGVPLLLLVTYRIGYMPPFGSRSFSTTLTLQSFSEAETLAMAGQVLGTAQFPAELQAALMAKAEGVPLFIEEVTKTLLDLGVLQRENGAYRLVKRLSEVRVPDTIQDIIMARLDRLGDDGKRTVQLASVIGRQFLVRLLARVAGLSERLEGLLRELQALEIIYEQGLVPEPAYIFKHAVIQDVAYQSLLLQRRKALHRAVGEAIEELYQDRLEEHIPALAHHFVQGEVWDKAVTYCQQAGARAHDHAAFREAVGSFEQALQALTHLPESGDTRERAIELRLALGRTLYALGEFEQLLTLLGEAEARARALDDRARLGRVLAQMAQTHRTTGDLDDAIAAGQQALALATALGDRALQGYASQTLGQTYATMGDFGRATELLRRNVEAADWESDRVSTYERINSQAWLARTLSWLGAFAEGQRHGEEALRLATLAGREATATQPYVALGELYLAQGDLEHAIRVSEQGLALCRVSGNRTNWRSIAASLGYASALQGRLAEGHALLEEAVSVGLRMGALRGQAYRVTWLSEVCRLEGHGEEAWQHAHQALDLARQLKERGNEAIALHQLGVVQAHVDPSDTAQAEAHYQQALALGEELGMRPLQAHCHRGLGMLYAATGQREQARAELATAVEMYRSMEMTFWLPQTEGALVEER